MNPESMRLTVLVQWVAPHYQREARWTTYLLSQFYENISYDSRIILRVLRNNHVTCGKQPVSTRALAMSIW